MEVAKTTGLVSSLTDNAPKPLRDLCTWIDSAEKIKQYPSDVNEPEWDKIKEALQVISFDMGQRTKLTEFELLRLCMHLKDHFSELTNDELLNAFGLYTAKKLDYKENYYQSFDKLFMGNVLSSYNRWKAEILAQKTRYSKPNVQDQKKFEPLKHLEEVLFEPYRKMLEDGRYRIVYHEENKLFNFLANHGIITPESISWNELLKEAKEILREENGPLYIMNSQTVKFRARRLGFKNWIMEQLIEEVDIEKLIKEVLT